MDGEAGWFGPGGITMGLSGWVSEQCPELLDEAVNALGLRAAISGEVQRVADHDTRATMASREAEDGALIAAGLRREYKALDIVFVAHTTDAWEFSEADFRIEKGGGEEGGDGLGSG